MNGETLETVVKLSPVAVQENTLMDTTYALSASEIHLKDSNSFS